MGTNTQRRDVRISCIEFFDVHSLCCCHVRIKKSNIYIMGGGGGTQWCGCLGHCTAIWNVKGSIQIGSFGFFVH